MEGLTSVLLILVLFFLRLGVPILVTIAIGYGLSRLDAKWRREAEREARAQTGRHMDEVKQQPAGQPLTIRLPETVPSGMFAMSNGPPCWDVKGCSEAMRAKCAAFRQPTVPCWQARTQAEGRLPATCKGCHLCARDGPGSRATAPGALALGQSLSSSSRDTLCSYLD